MLFRLKDYSQTVNQYDYSEPVYFVKVEAKGIYEEVMTDTYGHTLNSGEKYRESIYKRTIEEVK